MKITKEIKEYYKSFSQHGSGDNLVEIEPKEILLLLTISYYDLFTKYPQKVNQVCKDISAKEYFCINDKDIDLLPDINIEELMDFFDITGAFNVSEFTMYFKKLCDLHRRRFKYRSILKNQPFPTVEQIGPRSLLEYGNCNNDLLFNWMSWRKWSYDIDNRSAQETGYLFEPILVSCIGGETISHSKSPVKRVDENDEQTTEGRQIDCYVEKGKEKIAYELKMRVTIAASGQGRFNEELTFPKEAKKAGVMPILVVFDPTDSTLLTKLTNAYLENNGQVYIGDNAWNHLKKEAGKAMGLFISKYIEPPIKNMEISKIVVPYSIKLETHDSKVIISDSNKSEYIIHRK